MYHTTLGLKDTVDWEIFAIKVLSDGMASLKLKHANIMCIINDSVVRGRLSENYLNLSCEILETRNIRELCNSCTMGF